MGMQHNIRCPAEGCTYSLWRDDVKGLVPAEMYKMYQNHRNADYMGHLKQTLKESGGAELKKWLRKHARPCPDCHVIVSRSEGCDDMRCVCGTRFCYKCGHKTCKCRAAEQDDIWDPKV